MEICHLLSDTFQEKDWLIKFIIHLLPSKGSLCKLSKEEHIFKEKTPHSELPHLTALPSNRRYR